MNIYNCFVYEINGPPYTGNVEGPSGDDCRHVPHSLRNPRGSLTLCLLSALPFSLLRPPYASLNLLEPYLGHP